MNLLLLSDYILGDLFTKLNVNLMLMHRENEIFNLKYMLCRYFVLCGFSILFQQQWQKNKSVIV